MITPQPHAAVHKAWLYRLLSAIADDIFLVKHLRFKGGTCAAMREIIDRFSVDLDFDLLDTENLESVHQHLEKIFRKLGLKIKEKSQHAPQYFLKYDNKPGERNTVRFDVTFPPPKSNDYEAVRFAEIDRILYCQTGPTMFANKLVALLDRYEKHHSIAGRDLYDIHTFFIKGYSYKPEIIKERTDLEPFEYLPKLKNFITQKITQTIIDQDLNVLMPTKNFHKTRNFLKQEVLMFLQDEIEKLNLK